MMNVNRCSLVFMLFLVATPARAQVASGPSAGEKTPPLKVMAVTGEQENKELDYVAERKDKPTIYVFVQADQFNRPIARFIKELDKDVKKDSEQAYIVAVWLTEDKDKTKEYLPRIQQSLKMESTALTYFPGEKSGPNGWGMNTDAAVTVVVVNKTKVAASFGHRSINEANAKEVLDALKKAIEGN